MIDARTIYIVGCRIFYTYDAALQHAKRTLDGCNIDSIILQEYNLTNTISVQKPIKQ